jgi:hypothetical protein
VAKSRLQSSWRARDLEFEFPTDPLTATVGNLVPSQQIAIPPVSTSGQQFKSSNPVTASARESDGKG